MPRTMLPVFVMGSIIRQGDGRASVERSLSGDRALARTPSSRWRTDPGLPGPRAKDSSASESHPIDNSNSPRHDSSHHVRRRTSAANRSGARAGPLAVAARGGVNAIPWHPSIGRATALSEPMSCPPLSPRAHERHYEDSNNGGARRVRRIWRNWSGEAQAGCRVEI